MLWLFLRNLAAFAGKLSKQNEKGWAYNQCRVGSQPTTDSELPDPSCYDGLLSIQWKVYPLLIALANAPMHKIDELSEYCRCTRETVDTDHLGISATDKKTFDMGIKSRIV